MYEKSLQAAGLTQGEAEIYEILLNLGPSPAQSILKKTALKRGNVYNILASLETKGLISKKGEVGPKTIFIPASPLILEELLSKQEETVRQGKQQLQDVLDNLRSLYALVQEKPVIRFYEGLGGIKNVLYDSLMTKGTIYTFMDIEALEKYAQKINAEYVKKRLALNIPKKVIALNTPFTQTFFEKASLGSAGLTTVRLLPQNIQPFKTGVQIYDRTVSFTTLTEQKMLGVIIEDDNIAQLHRSLFEYIWSTLTTIAPPAISKPPPVTP